MKLHEKNMVFNSSNDLINFEITTQGFPNLENFGDIIELYMIWQ